jgi:hypothetical protein
MYVLDTIDARMIRRPDQPGKQCQRRGLASTLAARSVLGGALHY